MYLHSVKSVEISMSVSTYESENFSDDWLGTFGTVGIGAVAFLFGKSGGDDAMYFMELKLWYNSFCNLPLASLSKVTISASNKASTGRWSEVYNSAREYWSCFKFGPLYIIRSVQPGILCFSL